MKGTIYKDGIFGSRALSPATHQAHLAELAVNAQLGRRPDGGAIIDWSQCLLAQWMLAGNNRLIRMNKNGQPRIYTQKS